MWDSLETFSTKLMLLNKAYNSNMKVVVPFLLHQYGERNSIHMEVETPEQKKWMLEVAVQKQESSTANVEVTFKSINNNNYQLTSELQWRRLDTPFGFEAQTRTTFISPQNKRSQFILHAKNHISTQQRIIYLAVSVS